MNRPPPKSLTGHHYLSPNQHNTYVSVVPNQQRPGWTFGRGAVIWRIWPAVGVHTLFAAIIVSVSMKTPYHLGIPNVLMTIMGLILGFVISYRVSSGYDRYWWGRCYWSDLVRNCRTMGRLIWFHVPARKTPNKAEVTQEDINQVVAEKKLALDMLQGFAVAVKHHLRGEPGPYYEDLYSLIECMEENPYHTHQQPLSASSSTDSLASAHIIRRVNGKSHSTSPILVESIPNPSSVSPPRPIERWRTFQDALPEDESRPLLPSSMPPNRRHASYDSELIPFSSVASGLRKLWKSFRNRKNPEEPSDPSRFKIYKSTKGRNRPSLAGGGTNLPLDILRSLSEWLATLEDRGTVPGTSMGPMIGTMAALEDSLTGLERILTTPLPFVYSVHIRQTVWIYLFFLPFQLVDLFGWVSIPGTALAAFFFLGFLAAGEEIEQPFGTDANDLDMDLWCREIIHVDATALAISASVNATFAQPTAGGATINPDGYGGSIVDAARRAAAAEDTDDEGENPVVIKPGKKPSSSNTGTATPFLPTPAPPPSGPVATTTTTATDMDPNQPAANQPAATMPIMPNPQVAVPMPPPPAPTPIVPPSAPAPSTVE